MSRRWEGILDFIHFDLKNYEERNFWEKKDKTSGICHKYLMFGGRLQHFIDAVRNLVEENYLKAQGSSSS